MPNVPQVEHNFKCHHRRNACKYKTFKPQYGVLVWISVIYHNIVRKENLGTNGLIIVTFESKTEFTQLYNALLILLTNVQDISSIL